MSNNITLMTRVAELTAQHGSLRAAARALKVDPGYFYRLGTGVCDRPGKALLRRMGLRQVVAYEQISYPTLLCAPERKPAASAPPHPNCDGRQS